MTSHPASRAAELPGFLLIGIFNRALLFVVFCSAVAPAAESRTRVFDIPPGKAERTLKLYSSQSGREVIFATSTTGKVQTNGVKGNFSPTDALERLLKGTGLISVRDEASGILSVTSDPKARKNGSPSADARPDDSLKKKPIETRENPPPMKRNNVLTRLTAALALFSAPAYSQLASNSGTPANSPEAEKAIELTPFTVTADQDVGYLAANTLAGSRMNTALKDTAASISVFTREFIDDLAATDLGELLAFGNNVQPNVGDEGSFGDSPTFNDQVIFNPRFRVRGIPAELARNYFRWDAPSDTYNVSRVEDSRGPNSILFGIGSPGGIINVATKRAELRRTLRQTSVMTDNNGSLRFTFDVNQPMGDKSAVRVNAVWGDKRSHLHHVFDRNERVHLAATYRFNRKWQARVEYELGKITQTTGRNNGITDNVLPWLQAGRPTFLSTTPAANLTGLGTRLAQALRFISNSGQLIDMRNQVQTQGAIPFYPLTDTTIADRSINVGGPGQRREIPAENYAVFLEGQIGSKTAVEFAYNHLDYERTGPDIGSALFADANAMLPGNLGPNPFAGRLYVEGTWRLNHVGQSTDTFRGTISRELDVGKWGNYRVALLGEWEKQKFRNGNTIEYWAGAPFNANPINIANRVVRRTYVTEYDWDTYYIEGPTRIVNATDPITGRTLTSNGFTHPQSINDITTTNPSGMLGLQASWFDRRLVLGAGYREDHIKFEDPASREDPQQGRRIVLDYSNIAVVRGKGKTYSMGAVGHLNKYFSVLYNMATNVDTPDMERNILPKFELAPPPEGEGKDYGVAFELPGGQLYARLVRFTTAGRGEVLFAGGALHANLSNRILEALRAANLVSSAEYDKRYLNTGANQTGETRDLYTEGYELSITGNPTKNLRLVFNYSQTDGVEENIMQEVLPWWADAKAFYTSPNFPQDLATSGANTIASEIVTEDEYIANRRSVENVGVIGNRKHKFNIFTRYTFSNGFLKGAYVGGGYRYDGKMLVGMSTTNTLQYTAPVGEATLLVGYDKRWQDRRRLNVQLNISNLFDESDPIKIRYSTNPLNFNHPRSLTHRVPRTARLTATFSF